MDSADSGDRKGVPFRRKEGLRRSLDETSAIATYRINIRAEVANSQAFLDALGEEFGLAVTPASREIDMLVIE